LLNSFRAFLHAFLFSFIFVGYLTFNGFSLGFCKALGYSEEHTHRWMHIR